MNLNGAVRAAIRVARLDRTQSMNPRVYMWDVARTEIGHASAKLGRSPGVVRAAVPVVGL